MLSAEQYFVLATLLITIILFIWDKYSPDVIGMLVLFMLFVVPVNGKPVLTASAATLGSIFADEALLVVIFLFIVGAAFELTGVVDRVGAWLGEKAGGSPSRLLWLLGASVVPLSAFMNNTTVVVVFLPVILKLCRTNEQAPSKYLIPLSYFAIAGGFCTTIGTSTNLLVNGKLEEIGQPAFTLFEISGVGVAIAAAVVLYVALLGYKFLPERVSLAALINSEDGREFLTAAIIGDQSPLAGKSLPQTALAKMKNLRIIEIRRRGNRLDGELTEITFEPGDRLIMKTRASSMAGLSDVDGISVATKAELGLSHVQTEKATIMEAMVGPKSRFVGKTLREIHFRQEFGLIILAVHRQGVNLQENFENTPLEYGDTLLLEGSRQRMDDLFKERDFVNLSMSKQVTPRQNRAWAASVAFLWIIGTGILAAFGVKLMDFTWVCLAAALIVVLGGAVKVEEIYTFIDWKLLVMIIGTFAIAAAMKATQTNATIIGLLAQYISGWPPFWLISGVVLFSIVMTELLSNAAVASLFTPLAVQMALQLNYEVKPFALAVMMGASIGFAIPYGYQTHMLVFGAGGYRGIDFVKSGVVLDLLCWIVGSVAIYVLFPLN